MSIADQLQAIADQIRDVEDQLVENPIETQGEVRILELLGVARDLLVKSATIAFVVYDDHPGEDGLNTIGQYDWDD